MVGSALSNAQGQAVCAVNQPMAFLGAGMKTPDANDYDPWLGQFKTDQYGCMFANVSGVWTPIDQTHTSTSGVSAEAFEPGYNMGYSINNNTCGTALQRNGMWGSNPGGALLQAVAPTNVPCSFALTNNLGQINGDGSNTVYAMVVGGSCTSNPLQIPVGNSCTLNTGFQNQAGGCSVSEQTVYNGYSYWPSVSPGGILTLTWSDGVLVINRIAPGTATVTIHELEQIWSIQGGPRNPNGLCVMTPHGSIAATYIVH